VDIAKRGNVLHLIDGEEERKKRTRGSSGRMTKLRPSRGKKSSDVGGEELHLRRSGEEGRSRQLGETARRQARERKGSSAERLLLRGGEKGGTLFPSQTGKRKRHAYRKKKEGEFFHLSRVPSGRGERGVTLPQKKKGRLSRYPSDEGRRGTCFL